MSVTNCWTSAVCKSKLCGKFNRTCNKSGVMKRVINNHVANLPETKTPHYARQSQVKNCNVNFNYKTSFVQDKCRPFTSVWTALWADFIGDTIKLLPLEH